MIKTLAILFALSQVAPAQQDWLASGTDPHHPTAVVVSGRVKLSQAEARDVALEQAANELRYHLESRGRRMIEDRAPMWLPSFATTLTLDRWLRGLEPDQSLNVIASEIEDHDHGSYRSYQAHLLVERDDSSVDRSLGVLRARLKNAGRLFLAKCGGTVVFWGLLALLFLWLDRLTRGYMTWRLRGLFAGVGLALPTLAFVLV